MGDWRETVRDEARFRDVPFFVDVAEREGGRRTVPHVFPLRDKPFIEDMGRALRMFPVEGYVVGDDYLAQRDALIAALEDKSGPGELVHPRYGTRQVICVRFRVREATADGGMARFAIDFGETESEPALPVPAPAGAELVDADGDALVAAMRVQCAARKAVSLPTALLAAPAALVADATDALHAAVAPVVAGAQALATLKRGTDNLLLDAAILAREPGSLLDGLLGVLGSLDDDALPPPLGITALLAAYGFVPSSDLPPTSPPTRAEERELFEFLAWIARLVELVRAAHCVAAADFDSYDAAVAARDAVADALDEQAAWADDDTFAAMEQMRADLVKVVPGEATDLPRLLAYTPPYTVPSLVLAHTLYGGLDREADLIARNGVARPGFVPGGVELEVLSDAVA